MKSASACYKAVKTAFSSHQSFSKYETFILPQLFDHKNRTFPERLGILSERNLHTHPHLVLCLSALSRKQPRSPHFKSTAFVWPGWQVDFSEPDQRENVRAGHSDTGMQHHSDQTRMHLFFLSSAKKPKSLRSHFRVLTNVNPKCLQ